MSFQESFKNLKEMQELANLDLNGTPSASRPGWESRKREAQLKLPEAFTRFLGETKANTTVLTIAGDTETTNEFVKIASGRQDTVVLNRDDVYFELAKGVFPQIGASGQFGIHNFYSFMRELNSVAADIGLTIQRQPSLKPTFVVKDLEHLAAHVRDIIEETFGPTLAQRFLQVKAARALMGKSPQSDKVFVVLTGGDSKFAESLGSKAVTLTLEPPVTEENVAEAYAALKQQPVQKTKNKQKQNNKKDESNE